MNVFCGAINIKYESLSELIHILFDDVKYFYKHVNMNIDIDESFQQKLQTRIRNALVSR